MQEVERMSDTEFAARFKKYKEDLNLVNFTARIKELTAKGSVKIKFGKAVIVRKEDDQRRLDLLYTQKKEYIENHYADLLAQED